jgi:hypothetical protein
LHAVKPKVQNILNYLNAVGYVERQVKQYFNVGFEVLNIKCTIFLVVIPYNLVQVDLSFGGTYCLDLQRRRISYARNQQTYFCPLFA